MAKPIWELEPEVIDAELERARRAHQTRSEKTPKPSTTTPPPLPAAFAAGTNRSRGQGPVAPPPTPPAFARGTAEDRSRVIEMEAEYDAEFNEFEEIGGKTEFEGIQSTAEIEAPLLSELRAQTTKPSNRHTTAKGPRSRQPATTPTYPLKPSEMEKTTPRAAAAPRPAAKKNATPVQSPNAPVVPRTISADVPSKVISPSDTAYSMVRKNSPSSPPMKKK